MRPSYNAPEAPTHLGAGDLPPGLLDDEPYTSAARPSRSHSVSAPSTRRRVEPGPAAAAPRVVTEPASGYTPPARPQHHRTSSVVGASQASASRRAGSTRGSTAAPLPPPPAGPASTAMAAEPVSASAASASAASASASRSSRAQPDAHAIPAMPPGFGAVDPLAIPTPPELAGPIYGHIRRLALQADLAGGDRVVRDAIAELTSSLSCAIVYPGQDGLWTLGADDEIPRDPQPLIAAATARRAVIASHMALVPVVTTSETIAVLILTRNPRQPGYQPVEQVAMVALAREAAPILHHLAVQHLQRATEIKADKGSLYRGEALEAHRTRGQEGTLVHLSPAWVKRAYPLLVVVMLIAIGFAVFIRVPTYSTGTAVIVFEGSTSVTATAGGTVERVFVTEQQLVKKGDPLVLLNSPEETAQLTQAETQWHDTVVQFLFDQSDEQVRRSLLSAVTARDHARDRLEARTIRATRDGVVTNLHVKAGAALQLGGYVLQITDENSPIEVLAFLPGKDGPRIRPKMALQLEIDGYTKARAHADISYVQVDSVSATEIAKLGGDMLAESIAKELSASGAPSWIAVRAKLGETTFKADRATYRYHHGMHAKVEVKVQSKPFLVTLLPALEKYLPE